MNPLSVSFISFHCCIRVLKEYVALSNTDAVNVHSTRLFTSNMMADTVLPFTNQAFYVDKLTLMELVKHSKFDIYHCHNEPDWFPQLIRSIKPKAKIVLDCHDSMYMRFGVKGLEEREQFEAADAYIFPSQTYMEELTVGFNLDPDKPKLVVHSMCNRMVIEALSNDPTPTVRTPGIVYEGGAVANPEEWNNINMPYVRYRDHINIVKELKSVGIPFYMFGLQPKYVPAYSEAGAIATGRLPYAQLMQSMTSFDWGFVGTDVESPQCHSAMANKMFEYIAAGIPVIVMNSKEMGSFVENYRVGIHVSNSDELIIRYDEHRELRANVKAVRAQFNMEKQAGSIIGMYRQLLDYEDEEACDGEI